MVDYIRQLGPLVLDHRFRRLTEHFLRVGEECYAALQLPFRARWASTYLLLEESGPLGITEIADALRLTHPAVIAITDEMRDAGIVSSTRDRNDARRRAIALTPKARSLSRKLHELWTAMSQAQRRLFADAKCDIVAVLDAVDESLATQPLADEILRRARGSTVRSKGRAVAAATALLLAVCVGRPAALHAQLALDGRIRTALVQAIADSLVGGYIYEDRARDMRDSLLVALRRGDFDAVQEPGVLARRLGEFLQHLSNDRHLNVRFSSEASPTPGRLVAPSRPGSLGTSRDANYGFERVEILPGNVGYVEMGMFAGDPAALQRADSIMKAFADVSALIIDLRRNMGGGPQMVRHLSTYLFDKRTHLVSSFTRGMSAPQERWTLDSVPGKRLTNTPVYILTSRRTFSAAESFTFGLKAAGRVTIVGERTGGGGHYGRGIPLVAGFTMFLPIGRTYDPRTDKGWEAEGIAPDVEVAQERALDRTLEIIRSKASG